jgi:putative phage-type endonuclease
VIERVTFGDRDGWLAARTQTIGASEAAAALGLSPWESPRELYLRKRGLMPPTVETQAMRIGSLMEPVLAQLYEEETGRQILDEQVFLRSTLDPMSATLDGITDDGRIVEMKCVGGFAAKELGQEGSDEIPDHWMIQAHQQMLLHGSGQVDFAVLVGGTRFKIFEVQRNELLCEELAARIPAFWCHVEKGIAPASDGHADTRIMHLLYPGCEGEIPLDHATMVEVDLWAAARQNEQESAELKQRLKGMILDRLGNHAAGRLPDGRIITRKVVATAEHTIRRKASTSIRLYLKESR